MNDIITFKTTQEIWEWLIAGETIEGVHNKEDKVFLKNGVPYSEKGKIISTVSDPCCWVKVLKKEWYEEIPEKGRLCWVCHNTIDLYTQIAVIVQYMPNRPRKFMSKTKETWYYAVPLTNAEIKEFLY